MASKPVVLILGSGPRVGASVSSALAAKGYKIAVAARKAAEFALEVGINKVVLEGDSGIVYKDLNNNGPSLALHGHLIQDVKASIPLFTCICFSHVGQLGNKVAHSLARRAILSPNLNV